MSRAKNDRFGQANKAHQNRSARWLRSHFANTDAPVFCPFCNVQMRPGSYKKHIEEKHPHAKVVGNVRKAWTPPWAQKGKRVMKKFVYSSYWHTWSRVLGTFGYQVVEVNLTPINPSHPNAWEEQVMPIRIRRHVTTRSERDIETAVLPEDVICRMISKLGIELVDRLIGEDFLPQIDWELYEKKCNGGADLSDILKKEGV